jgi:hypothetical protein
MWIPKDLNDNVRILSLSYDSNVVASVHNDVTEIGKNLVQSLVINSRCDYFPIYEHLIPCHVFQLNIISCVLTSLNKLFVWGHYCGTHQNLNIVELSNSLRRTWNGAFMLILMLKINH